MARLLWADWIKRACEVPGAPDSGAVSLRFVSVKQLSLSTGSPNTETPSLAWAPHIEPSADKHTQTYAKWAFSSTSAKQTSHFWIISILLLCWGRAWWFISDHSPAPGSDRGAPPCPSPAVWSVPSAACCGLWSPSELAPGPQRSPPSRPAVREAAGFKFSSDAYISLT